MQKNLITVMTMSAVERENQEEYEHEQHEIPRDSVDFPRDSVEFPSESADFKTSINKAVNNVLEGEWKIFILFRFHFLFNASLKIFRPKQDYVWLRKIQFYKDLLIFG